MFILLWTTVRVNKYGVRSEEEYTEFLHYVTGFMQSQLFYLSWVSCHDMTEPVA